MEIQLWREILEPYELAVRELSLKFDHLMTEYREHGRYCPFLRVDGRVKSVSSILEKAQKKKIPFEMIEEEMEDIAGIRIICQFVEDIDKVDVYKRQSTLRSSPRNTMLRSARIWASPFRTIM